MMPTSMQEVFELKLRKVLALSPHTDDVELGAGGTLVRYVDQGDAVRVVALSRGNGDTGATVAEFERSMDHIGVTNHDLLGFEARRFADQRQEILQWLWDAYGPEANWRPDVVFCPAPADRHQDHAVVAAEAVRAFPCATILGYEEPRNATHEAVQPTWFVKLLPRDLYAKIAALACYESQAGRPAMDEKVIKAAARVRGLQCCAEFAEAFQVLRHVE